jgi:carbonic anhydrase/acetyltransferase-like protein (isoleucine patch superfamily)
VLGEACTVGRGAYISTGVRMGRNCKVQNYALVYEPAVSEDGVFVGVAVVFTNDHFPRSVSPDGTMERGDDWEPVGVTCREGPSVVAHATCMAPVTIGRWAIVAAGVVVTRTCLTKRWWPLRARAHHMVLARRVPSVSEEDMVRYATAKPEPLRTEHEAFRDAVLGKDAAKVTMRQSLATVAVAEALFESATEGARFTWLPNPPDRGRGLMS